MRSLAALLVALLATPAIAAPPWTDPAPYCRAVGTIDAPDSRYAGPAIPDWIARALMRAVHAPATAPLSAFRHAAWRCQNGVVLACSVGANIPCGEKADTGRTPSEGAARYCAANPDSAVVPAYAAGRTTIFAWRCAGGTPQIVRHAMDVDKAGYASAFWHRVTP